MPAPSPSSGPANLVPPAGSIYLGAFANPTQAQPPSIAALAGLEAQIGRTFALTEHYYGFSDAFPGAYEADDLTHGRVPIESWDCGVPNAAIANGQEDAVIKQRADALRAYGRPVFLRYMWEMNLPSSAHFRQSCYDPATDSRGGVFSPSEFIAAWTHMRAIFAREGAANVIWLWNVAGANAALAYYPGSDQVDWVGLDAYDGDGVSFAQTYQQAYGVLAPLGKPMMIGETGATASAQPAFFGSAVSTLQTAFPAVKGYVYFDAVGPAGSWVLTAPGLSAFTSMAADPYFAARAP